MKDKNQPKSGVLSDLLKGLVDRPEANIKPQQPAMNTNPSAQPALYEDAGSGYNSNFVFPQE